MNWIDWLLGLERNGGWNEKLKTSLETKPKIILFGKYYGRQK